ncbi:hypothetical protein [Sphingomonas phage Carli]|nr:hypothetical protein [Sphingomonas phage Carli]
MSWDIIGWLILGCLALIFVVGPLLRVSARWMLWFGQRAEREAGLPLKYSRWVGVWGGTEYRVNDMTGSSAVISTDPNNMGGVYTSLKTWQDMVQRHRLVRID